MRFFLDNCLAPAFAPAFARALRALAEGQPYEIVHLAEKFERRDTPDPVWLRVLGEEGGWVVVSGDARITRGKVERAAWRESGLTAFFLADGWASRSKWNQAADLVGWWPDIVREARDAPTGAGVLIPKSGKEFKRLYVPERD